MLQSFMHLWLQTGKCARTWVLFVIFFNLFIFILSVFPGTGNTAQTTLSWVPPATNEDGTPITDLSGYKVYYGTSTKSYPQTLTVGNVTTCTVGNLADGTTYYFAITAVNSSLKESKYSNEISRVMPAAPHYALSISRNGAGNGTVTSSPAGIMCGSDCTESYIGGTVVTLTASADGNSIFSGWSGACTGTGACVVTMTSVRTVTASFTLKSYTITSSAGAGGSISPSGSVTVNHGASQTFTITADANYSIADVLIDGNSTGAVTTYTFSNVTANHSLTASFKKQQDNILSVSKSGTGTGTVTSSPAGIMCGSDCTESYIGGTVVTLMASADGNSIFSGWSGVCTGTGACIITMDAAKSVTAVFTGQAYTITASAGAGGSISPSGSVTVNHGASQTFTITADANYSIADVLIDGNSTGAVTTYTFSNVTANHSLTASFKKQKDNMLSVSKSGTGTGTVTSTPAGINCGSDCIEIYNAGTSVTLTAAPDAGSGFAGWSGVCTGTGACIVTMDAAKSVTAAFTGQAYTITASAGAGGSISPSGSVTVNHGVSQTFTITVNTNYRIEDVIVDNQSVGTTGAYTFPSVTANHTITAIFKNIAYPDVFVTPAAFNFSNVIVGKSSPVQIFSVTNIGSQDLNLGIITLTGADQTEFLLMDDNCSGWTLKPADRCTFSTLFFPSSAGVKSGHLLVPSNDPDTPTLDISLEGQAVVELENMIQLPQTGQDTSYASGDDGDVQSGIEWPDPRFIDNKDGTVTDTLTGLMWLQDGACLGTANWSNALDTVSGLNAAPSQYLCTGYSGPYSDWRVPGIREMESLINYGAGDASAWLNTNGFINIRAGSYWSSTAHQNGKQAWVIKMTNGNGTLSSMGKSNYVAAVRVINTENNPYNVPMSGQTNSNTAQIDGPVQTGTLWPEPRFFDNGDGTVTDTLTGLIWLKDGGCLHRKNWSEALITIAALNEDPGRYNCLEYSGNYTDWRMPNVRELESMLNYGAYDSSEWLNKSGFINIQASSYWTSTAAAFTNIQGWKIDVKQARVLPVKMRSNLYIWPVRNALTGIPQTGP
ncbi:MAG: DUF1566 domain-containing protein [Thermodesulfovibrionales bacterium]|nr:DUF1566 domain-containing protein [Thermodesulfovibrionales bacterium]